jgi:hypothetical protein
MRDIFSANIEERYQASRKPLPNDSGISKVPYGCGGAANAYLVLVGPSPGTASEGQVVPDSNLRPCNKTLTIGEKAMNFNWGNSQGTQKDVRFERWTKLCGAILGDEKYVTALTALFNLDWSHSGDQKALSKEKLQVGWNDHIWPLTKKVKPVILCPLTNQVWNIMQSEVEQLPIIKRPEFHFDVAKKKPFCFQFMDAAYPSFFIKPANHPFKTFSHG